MKENIIKEITYKNFGKCLEISNGEINAIITIDFGPRIIRYGFVDGENMLYEDINREISQDNISPLKDKWNLYGGHRLWAAPESFARTYYPDNDPVSYEIADDGVIFTPPVQEWTNLSCKLKISMNNEDGSLAINHEIKNNGAWSITLAPWSITAVAGGGIEIIPHPQNDTGLLPNRTISLWPYSNANDKRLTLGNKYIILNHSLPSDDKFKIGINNNLGFAMYLNHGELFIKKFDVTENGIYPDGGVSYESYLCSKYPEMEALAVLSDLKPNDSVSLCESWSLFKESCPDMDENKIDELVKKYVK